jgi:L-threonylcarbamoyladenylate synthase
VESTRHLERPRLGARDHNQVPGHGGHRHHHPLGNRHAASIGAPRPAEARPPPLAARGLAGHRGTMSRVLAPSAAHLTAAAAALARGELVGMPTETVYGLAARALDAHAVARIYAAKDRPSFNPLIAHVGWRPALLDTLDGPVIALDRLGEAGRDAARAVAALWPGPLTLVLPRGSALPDLTTAGLDTVAQALLLRVDGPLAAPSANRSGRISPTTASAVDHELGDRVAMVLDGGPCRVGIESTVALVAASGEVTVLRPGAVTVEALEAALGAPVRLATEDPSAPRSPGMTARHYAPDTPFYALPAPVSELTADQRAAVQARLGDARRVGVLTWRAARAALPGRQVHTVPLSVDGDPITAARRLFSALRALDDGAFDVLLAEPCPPQGDSAGGLGHALRDRLRRSTQPL